MPTMNETMPVTEDATLAYDNGVVRSNVEAFSKFVDLNVAVFSSNLEMYEAIERGIPVRTLDHVARLVAPKDSNWKFRLITQATYHRRKNKRPSLLNSDEGAKVARLVKVAAIAMEIFKDEDKMRNFLERKHPLLHGHKPIDLIVANEAGAEAVHDVLMAGAYGGGA